MPGSAAWMVHICARTLSAKAKARSSSLACSMAPLCTTPAQLKSTSSAGQLCEQRADGGLVEHVELHGGDVRATPA
jgi:hypothetical protein